MIGSSQYIEILTHLREDRDPLLLGIDGLTSRKVSINRAHECMRITSEPTLELAHGYSYIFGNPEVRDCLSGIEARNILVPGNNIAVLEDARVIGKTAALDGDGRLFTSSYINNIHPDEAIHQRTQTKNIEGFVIANYSGCDYIIHPHFANTSSEAAPTLFLPNLEPNNYGSFLIRVLPCIALAISKGIRFQLIVSPSRPTWLTSFLSIVGLSHVPLIPTSETYGTCFHKLYFPFPSERAGFIGRRSMDQIDKVLRRLEGLFENECIEVGMPLIYCSRLLTSKNKPHWRPLVNEAKITSIAREMGYLVVSPETLPLKMQIKLFMSARAIVGPSGSGMLNSVFARPGVKVGDIESYAQTVGQHARLYSSSSKIYSFCFGRTLKVSDDRIPLYGRPWEVDPDLAKQVLHWAAE